MDGYRVFLLPEAEDWLQNHPDKLQVSCVLRWLFTLVEYPTIWPRFEVPDWEMPLYVADVPGCRVVVPVLVEETLGEVHVTRIDHAPPGVLWHP